MNPLLQKLQPYPFERLRKLFAVPGRSDDFRALTHHLVLVATDLDGADAAPFGQPAVGHVPILRSAAPCGGRPCPI